MWVRKKNECAPNQRRIITCETKHSIADAARKEENNNEDFRGGKDDDSHDKLLIVFHSIKVLSFLKVNNALQKYIRQLVSRRRKKFSKR